MDSRTLSDFLIKAKLANAQEPMAVIGLSGGVSSDIVRVDLPGRSICVKSALAVLKVAGNWTSDVARNGHEADYLRTARGLAPAAIPEVLAEDRRLHAFAMPYFEPVRHPPWKAQLFAGSVSPEFATGVASVIAAIHAGTTGQATIARQFSHDGDFEDLRLRPYFRATADKHRDIAAVLNRLADRTAATKVALVHGDVSPKNILCGPAGPLLLDAECAWYGDPAFDAAFCLNHLMLKYLVLPAHRPALRRAFDAFAEAYRAACSWEPWPDIASRIASLLPALMLARVDGLSPVEYIADPKAKQLVRAFAVPRIVTPPDSLGSLMEAWMSHIAGAKASP